MPTTTKVMSSNPTHGELHSIQHYVIKFVSDRSVVSLDITVSFTNKTDRHDITKILLKVALNTINQIKSMLNSRVESMRKFGLDRFSMYSTDKMR